VKVAVVGSGIAGITTAYFLARAGHEVVIYDKRKYPAMATSYANGGQLSASNAETWNSWRSVKKGVKWLFKEDAPLKINPKINLQKYDWIYRFIKAIPQAESNTLKTCQWALRAHKLYKEIALRENLSFDMVEKGILHIYTDKSELENARKINKIYKKAGLARWEVSPKECLEIEPALVPPPKLLGGFFNETDFTGDIHKFCTNLLFILETKYKVKHVHKEIKNIDLGIPVIICAGVDSKALAKTIGDDLPIYPVKGYSITIRNPEVAPWTSMLDDEAKIVTARLGSDRLRVAGTAELNGYNTDIIQSRIKPLIAWSEKMFPGINTEYVTPWAGLRPMTPNMMPIVKRSWRNKNVYYNTGHGHLGWTLSAYTALLITKQISEKSNE
jgi:D-amino-acid dehydrogenase